MINKASNSRVRSKTKIRKRITGTAEKPRVTVYRSLDKIYLQMIDDTTGKTIFAASSLTPEVKAELNGVKGKIGKSKIVGKYLAQKAVENKITAAVFDRNGYRYHGRVQAAVEGLREGGLKI